MKLSDFSVLSFDCYGTLIDWETGILAALQPLIERSGRTRTPEADVLARFGHHESSLERRHGNLHYRNLLVKVHDAIAHEWGVPPNDDESAAFGASVGRWPAFPDTVDALRYLNQKYRLVILSNVDHLSFSGSRKKLGVEFDFVYTAEDIGSYKPDLRNFEYMLNALEEHGIEKRQILHIAQSLFHDHVPANRIGLPSVWVNRRSGRQGSGATPKPSEMPHLDFEFPSMQALVEAHQRENETVRA